MPIVKLQSETCETLANVCPSDVPSGYISEHLYPL